MPGRARGGPDPSGRAGQPDPGRDDPGRDDPEAVARLICLRLLTAAPRTRAQLALALRRKGIPDAAADAVLSRFAEVGLVDDAAFASAWVETRHHGRGLARRALAAELGRRGVDSGDIQAAVGRLSQETELATARALVERRLAATAGQSPQARVRRLAGMLARKGYPAGLAYRVVRDALEEAGDDPGAAGLGDDAELDAGSWFGGGFGPDQAGPGAGDPDLRP